ncbi:Triacylglycerol acylhydrolase [Oleispira antarctica RB-8]|uniref:Triacylglycerol acylhydrolase n=1 Tax=Oleispira antarctica RB-8 TaxID=698738 RepID=R4YKF7_OLEAN|nr:Triacylglycerol acylhydrolase [Oleispira antarctica RB-8]
MKKILIAAVATMTLAAPTQAGWFSNYFKYTKTKNPIVLVPGIFAFDTIAGIDYWYQIPSAIESRGGTVFVPKINAFDGSVERGEQLIAQLDEIKASSRGKITKFNLMGHSQGGVTSRYVMTVRPDLVASVTSMSTPHTGSPVADLLTGVAPEGTAQGNLFAAIGDAVGNLVNLLSNNKASDSDLYAMLSEFNKVGAGDFNTRYPLGLPEQECGEGPRSVTVNGHDIELFSWGGAAPLTSIIDPSDLLFATTSLTFTGADSDGITGVCANHFGRVLRDDYAMNHIDINNHVLGLVSLFDTNPKTVFKNHANRLKNMGL